MAEDMTDTTLSEADEKRAKNRRNLAIGFGLAATVALIYAVTMMRLAASIAGN